MIENNDFRFRDDMFKNVDGQTVPIELLTGKYKGVIFRFIKVGIKEETDGKALLQFEYELYDPAEYTETSLRKDTKFTTEIGLILNQMLLQIAEIDDANRENHPKEPVEERNLHEKSSSVSEG